MRHWLILCSLLLSLFVAVPSQADSTFCGHSLGPCASSQIQGNFLFNSQTTGAANTAVVVTLTAVASVRSHVYTIDARCSAGTSNLTITDGGTTIWSTAAAEVGVVNFRREWPTGLTGAVNSAVVITLATCGVGNTGTLIVQADKY